MNDPLDKPVSTALPPANFHIAGPRPARMEARSTALLLFGLAANLVPLLTFATTLREIAVDWRLSAAQSGWIGGITTRAFWATIARICSRTPFSRLVEAQQHGLVAQHDRGQHSDVVAHRRHLVEHAVLLSREKFEGDRLSHYGDRPLIRGRQNKRRLRPCDWRSPIRCRTTRGRGQRSCRAPGSGSGRTSSCASRG